MQVNEMDPQNLTVTMGSGYGDLDYSKPIFVLYIDVSNLSRQRSDEIISNFIDNFKYSGVQMWYVASNKTEIQCIYNPSK